VKDVAQYPFAPRSTVRLERGHYWAIPLASGNFGAGCVVGRSVHNGKASTRMFLAGVVAWSGEKEPTVVDLRGCAIAHHGFTHIKAITEAGGLILGKTDLKFGSLPSSLEALAISTWGYGFPKLLAEKYVAAHS